MRSITQKELAARLGLSQATVSRALGNDHQITRETRERVRKAAQELGYRPSVALASFHSKEHWTNRELRGAPIAVLFHTGKAATRVGGYEHLTLLAKERGFRLHWMDISDPKMRQGLGERLFNQGFQGILFAPVRGVPDDWLTELETSRFALVAIDRRMAEFGITAIHGAVRRTVTETLKIMRERGYERIGAALWNSKDHPDHMNRIGAFLAAQYQISGNHATDLLLPIQPGLVALAEEKRRFQAWVRRVRPDAVLLSKPAEREWLHEVNPRIACASALMQKDQAAWNGLAGYHVDYRQMAKLAIRHLENNIRLHHYGPEPRPVVVTVAGIWHEGNSLP